MTDGFGAYQDWLNARENARLAIDDCRAEGRAEAEAEAAYYRVKAMAYADLLAKHGATAANAMVKGDARVNEALAEYRAAQAVYRAACSAAQLFTNEESHCFHEYRRSMAGDREGYVG